MNSNPCISTLLMFYSSKCSIETLNLTLSLASNCILQKFYISSPLALHLMQSHKYLTIALVIHLAIKNFLRNPAKTIIHPSQNLLGKSLRRKLEKSVRQQEGLQVLGRTNHDIYNKSFQKLKNKKLSNSITRHCPYKRKK